MNLRQLSGIVLLVGFAPTIAVAASSPQFPQVEASQYPYSLEMEARSGELVRLDYEVISPYDDAVLYIPIEVEVGSDGRQYVLDQGDENIKVFGPDNEYLFAFGGKGQAPGEWQRTTLFTLSPDKNVYVWDDRHQAFHVFTADGEYLHRVRHEGGRLEVQSVAWISPMELVVSGLSLAFEYNGFVAHRFRIKREGDQFTLEKTASFIETRKTAPGLYSLLESGFLSRDLDGNLLFSATRRHEIAKYDLEGELMWRISDPTIMPDAATLLEATESGRVRIPRGTGRSAGTVSTEDWIINTSVVEVAGLPARPPIPAGTTGYVDTAAGADRSSVKTRKVLELIDRRQPKERRLVVDTWEDFWLQTADHEGRTLYGFLSTHTNPVPIRGRLRVEEPRPEPQGDGRRS